MPPNRRGPLRRTAVHPCAGRLPQTRLPLPEGSRQTGRIRNSHRPSKSLVPWVVPSLRCRERCGSWLGSGVVAKISALDRCQVFFAVINRQNGVTLPNEGSQKLGGILVCGGDAAKVAALMGDKSPRLSFSLWFHPCHGVTDLAAAKPHRRPTVRYSLRSRRDWPSCAASSRPPQPMRR